MTQDEVLAEFAKLPLGQQVSAAGEVIKKLNDSLPEYPSDYSWNRDDLYCVGFKMQQAEAVDHKRDRVIREVMQFFQGTDRSESLNHKLCEYFVTCHPHVVEGWPTE